jgi:radical SAM protein with 4Fe4S-binding SPASM domain
MTIRSCYFDEDMTLPGEETFFRFTSIGKQRAVKELRPLQVDFELTTRCAGSCRFCFASSTTTNYVTMPTDKVKSLLDDFVELGIRAIHWLGGDPLMHPNIYEIIAYAGQLGLRSNLFTAGIIPKESAKKLARLVEDNYLHLIGIHIDTLRQEIHDIVNRNPKLLSIKIDSYYNLIEAGIPRPKIRPCMTYTKPVATTVEETFDWFIDEMGARHILINVFKPYGFGQENSQWEPSLSEVRRACEYRAQKLSSNWLRVGPSDFGQCFCRTLLFVSADGRLAPCPLLQDLAVGNLYQERLKDLFYKHRDFLLFNFEIKGKCGNCDNNDVCFGCRGNAYFYGGDLQGSDPKCWLNPEAKESYCY